MKEKPSINEKKKDINQGMSIFLDPRERKVYKGSKAPINVIDE